MKHQWSWAKGHLNFLYTRCLPLPFRDTLYILTPNMEVGPC